MSPKSAAGRYGQSETYLIDLAKLLARWGPQPKQHRKFGAMVALLLTNLFLLIENMYLPISLEFLLAFYLFLLVVAQKIEFFALILPAFTALALTCYAFAVYLGFGQHYPDVIVLAIAGTEFLMAPWHGLVKAVKGEAADQEPGDVFTRTEHEARYAVNQFPPEVQHAYEEVQCGPDTEQGRNLKLCANVLIIGMSQGADYALSLVAPNKISVIPIEAEKSELTSLSKLVGALIAAAPS